MNYVCPFQMKLALGDPKPGALSVSHVHLRTFMYALTDTLQAFLTFYLKAV